MKWRYKCKIHISMKYWNKDFVSIFDTNMYVGFVSLYFNHNPDYNIVTLIFSLLIQVCYHIYFLLRYTTCVWYYPTRWNAYSMVLGWDIEVMYVKEIAGSEKYLWLCSMKECQIFYIKWDLHFNQTFYFSQIYMEMNQNDFAARISSLKLCTYRRGQFGVCWNTHLNVWISQHVMQ